MAPQTAHASFGEQPAFGSRALPPASAPSLPLWQGAAIMIATALLVAAIAGGVAAYALSLRQKPSARTHVAIILGERTLVVPSDLIVVKEQRQGGPLDRLDLVAGWPSFGAPQFVTRDETGKARPVPLSHNLTIAIMPSDTTLDPSERTSQLYGRFLEPDVWSNPGGLVMRRFQPGSPYQGEELFATPPTGREFAARCPASDQANGAERCLAILRSDGFDIEIGFDRSLLSHWRQLKDGVRTLLARAAN